MPTIPQELVDAILRDFDPAADRASLKSISLIATNFTGPAQRVLFCALSLHGHSMPTWCPSFERARDLLLCSPHLAAYVKGLTVRLPWEHSMDHHDLLEDILRLCPNVRRFVVKGAGVRWGTLKPGLQSALAARISTPGLDALYLISLFDVPVSVIYGAARHIPLLSVRNVSVEESGAVPASADLSALRLTHLIVALNPWNVFTMLQRTHLAHLQRLTFKADTVDVSTLNTAAPRLTHLEIDCIDTTAPFTFPYLPHLTHLDIHLSPRHALLRDWVLPTLAPLSDNAPALRALALNLHVSLSEFCGRTASPRDLTIFEPEANAQTLAALEDLLCPAIASPRCVWTLLCIDALVDDPYAPLVFGRFRAAVEHCMPRLRAEGRLVVREAAGGGYIEGLP
ncbi:hypothetical protein FB451DRAFT_662790 [Mycena latifolia]|nr:hypothetical protein FB451DRAFT_662790 [Mycena latifolia]